VTYLILLTLIVLAALALAARLFPRTGNMPSGTLHRRRRARDPGDGRHDGTPEEGAPR